MKRCDVCNGYKGEPTPVKVGDKVDFVIEKRTGNSIRMTARTGKLMLIKENGFSVIYRGTVYHADSVSSPADPSPISLAMFGRNPRQIARDFRSSIGLTSRQEQTVQRLRAALEKGEAGYVNSLTTVTDSAKNAVSAGKLSESQIDKIVEQTRLRYVKQRTETIARTESLRATSVGQDLAIREGQITGAISNELLKRWLYRHDTRTRDAHISAGETNGWIPMNRPFSTPLGPLMFPRDPNGSASNTINCRCRVQYSLPEDIGSLG